MRLLGSITALKLPRGKAKHVTPRGRNCDAAKLELESKALWWCHGYMMLNEWIANA